MQSCLHWYLKSRQHPTQVFSHRAWWWSQLDTHSSSRNNQLTSALLMGHLNYLGNYVAFIVNPSSVISFPDSVCIWELPDPQSNPRGTLRVTCFLRNEKIHSCRFHCSMERWRILELVVMEEKVEVQITKKGSWWEIFNCFINTLYKKCHHLGMLECASKLDLSWHGDLSKVQRHMICHKQKKHTKGKIKNIKMHRNTLLLAHWTDRYSPLHTWGR